MKIYFTEYVTVVYQWKQIKFPILFNLELFAKLECSLKSIKLDFSTKFYNNSCFFLALGSTSSMLTVITI